MKEDILEQMVDDWLKCEVGVFTKHNIKFKPANDDEGYNSHADAVVSDIDVVAVNVKKEGIEKVRVVSCKSYQGGFNPEHWWNLLTHDQEKKVSGREAWKHHRELCKPKWGKAFARKIFEETGSDSFIYTIAVARLNCNDLEKWRNKFANEPAFIENLRLNKTSNVKIELVTVEDMIHYYGTRTSKSVEPSQFGRLMQVIRASGLVIGKNELQ